MLDLLSSDALTYKTEKNPHPTRSEFVWEVVSSTSRHVEFTAKVGKYAEALNQLGIDTLDSMHLASPAHRKSCAKGGKTIKEGGTVGAGAANRACAKSLANNCCS